jgi:hypothetical protein
MLYQGWIDRILGLAAASITGCFSPPETSEQTQQVRECLSKHFQILDEIFALRTQANKEKQINRLVELNTKIKLLELNLIANKSTLPLMQL